MQTICTHDQLRRDLRARICPQCPLRPTGGGSDSSRIDVDTPNRCEAQCPLFLKLPALARRAALIDPMLRSREQLLRQLVHEPAESASQLPLRRTTAWLLKQYGDEVARLIAARFPD